MINDNRGQYLYEELRLMRVARGLTQEELAQQVSYSASLIGMIETGARKAPPGFWGLVDDALQTGGMFSRLAHKLSTPQWKVDWTAAERSAIALRSYEFSVVPGLLQTEAYIRALLRDAGLLNRDEVERYLAERMARQQVLTRVSPPQFTAVIDEGVLHRLVGGEATMRDQIEAIIKACEEPHIRVHVVPGTVGAYAGLNGPFAMATASDQSTTGYLDSPLRGHVVDGAEQIAMLQAAWESIRGEALPQRQSIELMRNVVETWS